MRKKELSLLLSRLLFFCGAVAFGAVAIRQSAAKEHLAKKLDSDLLPAAPQLPAQDRDCIHFLRTG